MVQVVICGAGSHGRVVADIIEEGGARGLSEPVRIAGYVDDDPALRDTHIDGYPVLGGRGILREL